MKGIIIVAYNDNLEVSIDTQFPSNLVDFLKINLNTLKDLSNYHLQRKMTPNFTQVKLDDGINVASFYSGFSFRHYVGTPNFTICIFLSEDDKISIEFEGMMRRIAHELLPKRDALNFDDILGKYYEMLKGNELTPYWEEIIEGENNILERNEENVSIDNKTQKAVENEEKDEKKEKISLEMNQVIQKNEELEYLLKEKSKKIRELTRECTNIISEKNQNNEELNALKDEIAEQYIKLEKSNNQLKDLNEKHVNLIEEVKDLNELIAEKDNEISFKDKKIKTLNRDIDSIKKIEKETEKLLQEIQDLKTINKGLNSEIEILKKQVKDQSFQIEKSTKYSSQNLDTITNLKIEIKKLKQEYSLIESEKEQLKSQIFDFKKEIKILRRERDHYMKLVKDNKLL